MSSIEERLVRDIAAVTQGVIVTEQHLREARSDLEEYIEIGQQRNRRRGWGLAAAAAVLIPIVGILAFQSLDGDDKSQGPSTTPTEQNPSANDPTVERVTGVWRVDNGVMLVQFKADGTVQFNDEGELFSNPSTTGLFEVEGDRITITTTRAGTDAAACQGTELVVRAFLPGGGTMVLTNTGSAAGPCTLISPEKAWTLEPILPNTLDFAPAGETFEPVRKPGILYGDWVAVGGGAMLELSPDGTYIVAVGPGTIVDSGQWTLADQQLQLTSGSESPTCAAGDRLGLGSLTHADAPPSEFLRGTVGSNTCRAAWAKTTWFLLPHDTSS